MKGQAKHLLIIRLSAMGDVAMTAPVVRSLAQQYPDVTLTVLSKPFFKPLFADIPRLDFYEADVKGKHRSLSGLKRLSEELKELGIDAVADLHHVLRSQILKIFFQLSGIPVARIDKGRKEKRRLTRGKVFAPLKTTHQRYADVFYDLGFKIDLSKHIFPKQQALTARIADLLDTGKKKWIGIAPFAAFAGKMYPLDLMEQVIGKLARNGDYQIILFGGGKKEGRVLNELSGRYKNALSVVGKLSFPEELQLISHLDLMLSMDSGNAHLAAIYGVKTVTLWGVTHPFAGFYPFAQDPGYALFSDRKKYPLIPTSVYGNKLPAGYEEVMRTIAPEQVVQKVITLVER